MPRQPEIGLALLRLVLGVVFVAHGVQKITWGDLSPLIDQFRNWGVPMPLLTAPLVATIETVGGALLFLGVAARSVAFALSCVMFGAIWYVHWGRSFFAPAGLELPLLLLGGSLAIMFGGPGIPSMDRLSFRRFPSLRRGRTGDQDPHG
ncbi:putative oxidoreductase [Deinococcus reticulitermitis]|uniref:Putative oxidoreductase n=1 Tax=Deinococcus reticulitermitis TaxID=856736 RepID=A0A1H6VVL2_9DEIO|nr:DoxX family protein [Deinococcus reticulitermitis]SEJ04095.1 putative oxidoreductase [Deinococcus reticulitermitis]